MEAPASQEAPNEADVSYVLNSKRKGFSPDERVKVLFSGECFEAMVISQNGRYVNIRPSGNIIIIQIEVKETITRLPFSKKGKVDKTGTKKRLKTLCVCEDFVFPL